MSKILKNKKGFTLAELLVSISIIALFATLTVMNFRLGQNSAELNLSAQKLASDIRRVQGYALSSEDFNGARAENGWGIHFIPAGADRYIIFCDEDGDKVRRTNGAEDVEEIFLSEGIEINKLLIDGGNATGGKLSVVFMPPDPTANICDVMCNGNEIDASVILTNGDDTKTVDFNIFGLVDVKD